MSGSHSVCRCGGSQPKSKSKFDTKLAKTYGQLARQTVETDWTDGTDVELLGCATLCLLSARILV